MKTLLVTIEFPPESGGIENYTYNLIKRISESEVLAPEISGAKEFDPKQDFKVIRKKILYHRQNQLLKNKYLTSSLGYLITVTALIWHTHNVIKTEKPDIIICSESVPVGIVVSILHKFHKIPYVVFSHSRDILFLQHLPFVKKLIKMSFNNASKIIVNSEFTRNLVTTLEIPEFQTYKIHPCVDSDYFRPMDVSDLREQYGLSDKKVILSVGRLVKRKGNDMVIKSLPQIIEKIPDVVYLIAGNGPYKKPLKKLISKLGLENHVRFIGYVPDEQLPYYYNLCDVFIMPSRTEQGDPEGFGIVYIEANACGIPVIGSNMGGIPDAILDGETGLLVNPYDAIEIADSIIELLSNKNKSIEMGKAGRTRTKKELNWEISSDRLKYVLHDSLNLNNQHY